MKKIAVVYWSGTGNTERMAEVVASGIKETGSDAELFTPSEFAPAEISNYDGIAFGCPSMGEEVLEETEFEPMFDSCRTSLKGKNIALFGSYGWGDGEWMRTWEDSCKKEGACLVCDSVICQEEPDSDAESACKDLGRALAE